MDFQKKYEYTKENIDNVSHGDLTLTVSVFDCETHLQLSGEDRLLLAYDTYAFPRPILPQELRQLINRQISVTGQVPAKINVRDFTGHFMLVPNGSVAQDQLMDLPMISVEGARRKIQPYSDRYDIICQHYQQFEEVLLDLVPNTDISHGVSHVNDLISVFNFEPEYAIYVHIVPGSFYGFLYKDSELLICVNHPYKNVADISYYLLKLLELRQVEQSEPELFVGGFITESSILIDQLKIFFTKVNLLILDGYQHLELMPEIAAINTQN